MAQQINVFVENRPGRLECVTKALAEAEVNIRAMMLLDRGDFGIVKLLVDDPKKGHLALVEEGLASALKPVVAVCVEDRPGGLHSLCTWLREQHINLLDTYGFITESRKQGVWVIEVSDSEKVEALLSEREVPVLSDDELYHL